MSTPVYEPLVPVLQSVVIASPASFIFLGEHHDVYQGVVTSIPGLATHPLPADPLVRDLQGMLYSKCYTWRIGDRPPNADLPGGSALPDPSFVQQLSAANQTQQRWDPNWNIYMLGANGQIFVRKGDRQRSAVPGEFLTTGAPGLPPLVGATVSLLVQREANGAQPGMYFAYSQVLSDVWDEFALVRFYFHSSDKGAPELMRYLTASLNKYQIPFRLKGPVDPHGYTRTDAVVLYVANRYFQITARLVLALPEKLNDLMRDSVPLFTRRLRSGVGLAEEPNTGESFGMHRCRLTAEGIVDVWREGNQALEGRMKAVQARFALNNLKLEKPYLNPGSIDIFELSEKRTAR